MEEIFFRFLEGEGKEKREEEMKRWRRRDVGLTFLFLSLLLLLLFSVSGRVRGVLSKAWLPEETITVDYLPQEVKVPRRWA